MQAKNLEKHIKQFNINLNHVLSGYWKKKAIQNRKNIAKLWLWSKDLHLVSILWIAPIAQKIDRTIIWKQQRKVKSKSDRPTQALFGAIRTIIWKRGLPLHDSWAYIRTFLQVNDADFDEIEYHILVAIG